MNKIISDNAETIKVLCSAHNVKNLFVFGSASTDKFTEKSDIDFLVSFNPMEYGEYAENYFALAEEFEKALGRTVDLVTDKSLSNPYFIESVNKSMVQIYG